MSSTDQVLPSNSVFGGQSGPVISALELLCRARTLASDAQCSPWEFAIEISRMRELGVTECELRWLIHKRWVEVAVELSEVGQGARNFGKIGGVVLSSNSCFVLSSLGRLALGSKGMMPLTEVRAQPENSDKPAIKPVWDSVRRELSVENQIVKRFRVPAGNQELILQTFNEERWETRVDDPLPPLRETDPKRRLQSAIMCLNRNQRTPLLRFRGDGRGCGILWELRA